MPRPARIHARRKQVEPGILHPRLAATGVDIADEIALAVVGPPLLAAVRRGTGDQVTGHVSRLPGRAQRVCRCDDPTEPVARPPRRGAHRVDHAHRQPGTVALHTSPRP